MHLRMQELGECSRRAFQLSCNIKPIAGSMDCYIWTSARTTHAALNLQAQELVGVLHSAARCLAHGNANVVHRVAQLAGRLGGEPNLWQSQLSGHQRPEAAPYPVQAGIRTTLQKPKYSLDQRKHPGFQVVEGQIFMCSLIDSQRLNWVPRLFRKEESVWRRNSRVQDASGGGRAEAH